MDSKPSFDHVLSVRSNYPRYRNPNFDAYFTILEPTPRSASENARAGIDKERKMTFRGGCRLYVKAIAWSILLSCTIIMEAYDKSLMGSFYAFPAFRERFGSAVSDNVTADQDYQLSASWQTGLINAAVGAEILGLFLNGVLTDRFGYKRTMIGSMVLMCLAISCAFFAANLGMLLMSQILCGLPWGVFQTLSATYAAEVLPVALRPFLLANINMCWLIGQLAGINVVHAFLDTASEWSYRIPFALQWVWAVPILVGVCIVPDGPWWLIRHGRIGEARQALRRLVRQDDQRINIDQMVHVMQHTNELEKELGCAGTSYRDCFRNSNRRRTEISCMVWLTQSLCGATFFAYAPYFYEQAGFNTRSSFKLASGLSGIAVVGGIVSWILLSRVGRRTLYIWGLVGLLSILLASGIVSVTMAEHHRLNWILGSFFMGAIFIYNVTIGPMCYVLVAEVPSTRLRVKTVVLARVAYNLGTIGNNVLTPLMLNPTAWNWKGKSCFWYAATSLSCLIWCYHRLPETKGLAYLELDILFAKNAPIAKFTQLRVSLENGGYLSLNEIETSFRLWHGSCGYA